MSERSLIKLSGVHHDSSSTARRRRVPAMAPDERRAALVAATLPLLREHGQSVSTRQIAQAAGVAEGTIFGVFPDKPSLIRAALTSAFDPKPVVRALGEIDPAIDIRPRLRAVVDLVGRRMAENMPLMAVLHQSPTNPSRPADYEFLAESRNCMVAAMIAVIEPDRARLRRSPAAVAQLLLMLIMATVRGAFGETDTIDSDEIVGLLLDGLLKRSDPTGDSA
jgi:AcrR family transcriptional regulator